MWLGLWLVSYSVTAQPVSVYRHYNVAQLQNELKKQTGTSPDSTLRNALIWLNYYNRMAQFRKSDSIGIAAQPLMQLTADSLLRAEVFRQHADALLMLGFVDDAHLRYLRSYKIAREKSDTDQWVISIIGLSHIYQQLNVFNRAEKFAKQGVVLARKSGKEALMADALFAYGNFLFYAQDTFGARPYFEKAAQYYFASQNNIAYAHALMLYATCQIHNRELEEASDMLNRVLFTFYNSQEYLLAAQCLNQLGDLAYLQQQPNDAAYYYSLSLQSAERIDAIELMMNSCSQLAQVYALQRDFESAYTYQRKYQSLKDKVLNASVSQQINRLDAQFQNTQNEERIKSLIVEQRLAADNAELKSKQQVYLLIALALVLIVLLLVWYTYQQKLHTQQILTRQKEQIHVQEIQEIINKKEIETMNAVIETQETERKRIAADLHDHVGSLLASVKLQFKSVQHSCADQADIAAKLNDAAHMLDSATNDIRRISHNLDSDVLNKFGLQSALSDLCSQLKSASAIDITFSGHYRKNALPNKAEMPLYRSAQELITNALKHANATSIEVQLNQLDEMVNLIVSDNGVGFDLNRIDLSKSLGWRNMMSRIEHLKGKIHIDSNPQSGTTVIIELPYESYD